VLREAPGVELVAVADPDPEALLAADDVPGYASVEEAVADTGCDAVLVASPPGTHHAVAKAALRSGKHALVEKPLATNLGDALDLVVTANLENRFLVVSQNYRYNGPFRAVRRVVAGGELGDLVSVGISCRRDTRTLFAPEDFRYSMRHPYVLDMSVHHFDLLRAATGRDVSRVYARGWRAPDSPFVHQPTVAALLDLEGGVPVLYEGDWATRGPETSWNGEWQVVGEEGRLLWTGDAADRGTGEVTVERWGERPRAVEQREPEFVERAGTLQALRAAIEDGETPETAAADNVKSLAVMLGCLRSIEEGGAVSVTGMLAAGSERDSVRQ
jgi:predicted dehydrogenase